MIRVVLDTNTLVSGLGWQGAPARVLDATLAGRLTLVTSADLLGEFARVLAYPKLAAVIGECHEIVDAIATVAEIVFPTERLSVLRDEPDNRVLEAAVAGSVDFVITGDRELQRLRRYRSFEILSAAEFLARGGSPV